MKKIHILKTLFISLYHSLTYYFCSSLMFMFQNQRASNIQLQFSCSVISDSLRPHELQHSRPPCSSPTPGVHPNPRPLRQWCHPINSSSVIPFFSCPQSFPAKGLFKRVSSSHQLAKVLEFQFQHHSFQKTTQEWSASEWTGWISLQSKGLSRVFSSTKVQKHQFFSAQLSL